MKQILVIAVSLFALLSCKDNTNEYGEFVGTVKVEWLDDGRKVKLLDDFAYIDKSGHHWPAPKGWVVDGASIPQLAWTLIGSPYVGKYRNASVIHDYSCDQHEQPWEDVHEAMYYAMRAADVSEIKAKTIYAAVYHFGPRWDQTMSETVNEEEVVETVTRMKKAKPRRDVRFTYEKIASAPKKAIVKAVVAKEPKTIREADFKTLQQKIETGGLDLAAIRQFKPQ